jgi:hypothetical protein
MTKARGKISLAKEPDPFPNESSPQKAKDKNKGKDGKDGKHGKDKGKDRKGNDEDVLIGQVKKVIKKSRRKLSEEKFEKQLLRTIAFLEDLQSKLVGSTDSTEEAPKRKRTRASKKTKQKTSVNKKKKPAAAAVKRTPAAAANLEE